MDTLKKIAILQEAKKLIDSVYYCENETEVEKALSLADTMINESINSLQKQ